HYDPRYATGEMLDCQSRVCRHSAKHMHRSGTQCKCSSELYQEFRVQNKFSVPYPTC
ncbi:hypothetical protein HYPSUDRAFT_104551, partial [Hypholoma sublateritium FD-334 SS-4]